MGGWKYLFRCLCRGRRVCALGSLHSKRGITSACGVSLITRTAEADELFHGRLERGVRTVLFDLDPPLR